MKSRRIHPVGFNSHKCQPFAALINETTALLSRIRLPSIRSLSPWNESNLRFEQREKERERIPRNLSISLINRYLQYFTKKAATFFLPFSPFFFIHSCVVSIYLIELLTSFILLSFDFYIFNTYVNGIHIIHYTRVYFSCATLS